MEELLIYLLWNMEQLNFGSRNKPSNFGSQVLAAKFDGKLTEDEIKNMLTDDQVAELKQKGSDARRAFLELSEKERKEFQKELGMAWDEVDGFFGPNTLDHMFLAAGMPEKVVLEKNKNSIKISDEFSNGSKEQKSKEWKRKLVNISDYEGLKSLEVFGIKEATISDGWVLWVLTVRSDSGERLGFLRVATAWNQTIGVVSADGKTTFYKSGQKFQFNGHQYLIADKQDADTLPVFSKID